MPVSTTYFYHSFPRLGDMRQGLLILQSILERGLYLAPEIIEFCEHLDDGTTSQKMCIGQKRICFTELSPGELECHAETFGKFAIEFEVPALRTLGASPVHYFPTTSAPGTLEGTAATLLSRLGETQLLLERLHRIELLHRGADSRAPLILERNGLPLGPIGVSIGDAAKVLNYLQADIQPISALLAAMRSFFGYFQHADNLHTGELLGYYRQREWRICGNAVLSGNRIMDSVTDDDFATLMKISPGFFGEEMQFPQEKKTRGRAGQFLRAFRGRPIHSYMSRIIVPREAILDARKLATAVGCNVRVDSLEGLQGS